MCHVICFLLTGFVDMLRSTLNTLNVSRNVTREFGFPAICDMFSLRLLVELGNLRLVDSCLVAY
jgi:hypothetical protein